MQNVKNEIVYAFNEGLTTERETVKFVMKNELLNILIHINEVEAKIKNLPVNSFGDKIENLIITAERIYDYVSVSENSRVTENYEYYIQCKNEMFAFFENKMGEVEKKIQNLPVNSLGGKIQTDLENLTIIAERIYDYVSISENLHVTEDFEYYKQCNNEMYTFFEKKMEELNSIQCDKYSNIMKENFMMLIYNLQQKP